MGNLLLVFHFPIRFVVGIWECGNRAAISKECGKRGVLSISPSFPQARFLFGRCFCFRFIGLLDAVARNVRLENDAVVHQAVDGRGGRHRIFEDAFPLGERQVAGDQNTAGRCHFAEAVQPPARAMAVSIFLFRKNLREFVKVGG